MIRTEDLELAEAQDQHTHKLGGIPHRCDACGGLIKPLRNADDCALCRCPRAKPRFKRTDR